MPRRPRQNPGGIVYHVLNRALARLPLFEKPTDYKAFLRVLAETLDKFPMRILSFVLMPNHLNFVLWPEHDRELSAFCRWLTNTHYMRLARSLSYIRNLPHLPGPVQIVSRRIGRQPLHSLPPRRTQSFARQGHPQSRTMAPVQSVAKNSWRRCPTSFSYALAGAFVGPACRFTLEASGRPLPGAQLRSVLR